MSVVVLLLALMVAGSAPSALRTAGPVAGPSVPDRTAGYSTFTGSVTGAPPGRAIALYGYGNGELFNMFQSLVVGADRDTYRRVDAMEDRDRPSALLAPDGTHVLLGDERGATDDLILVDLATGERRSIPLGATVGVRLLAWSPDGRSVAYSAAPLTDTSEFGSVNVVEPAVARDGTLRLLDVASGSSTDLPSVEPPWTAAFAPDSRRLAVQVGQQVRLIGLDGTEFDTVDIAAGRELAPEVGWSPDGRFLATVPWVGDGPTGGFTGHGMFLWDSGDVSFVPLDDADSTPTAVPDVARLLGWRSADTMVVATVDDAQHVTLAEVDRATASRRTLSRFDTGSTCELHTQPCMVFDLHLATGLLPDLTVRDAGNPQRGGVGPIIVNSLVVATLLGAAYLLWRRLRRTGSGPPRG
ncbi:hypothetical protein GCM10009687_59310 [Asanoa iriomotensis]|uniref:WD40 repeat protein n=1 Tax=Asanoa iriomotensis TaxID=234613 RepID=A0ABQ4BUC0_9ACTN|nr:hypothetical protein Air01nite_02200 [Asanoa iriomotensis]